MAVIKAEKEKDSFGINIMKYCREHEQFIETGLENGADAEKLLERHEKKLLWLQHERFIHLLVTILTAAVFLFLVLLEYLTYSRIVFLFLAVSFIMLAAYLIHYFRLENHVQHWYKIADRLYDIIENKNRKEE